jgi:uncharacterized protein YndB with AHSA1/START domain
MTSLALVRRIAARPSIVFDALTTPDGIACWGGPRRGTGIARRNRHPRVRPLPGPVPDA